MSGVKQFINDSDKTLNVTLFVRDGSDPANQAGTKDFSLNPHERKEVSYGNSSNIYLNGLGITAFFNGEVIAKQELVVQRGNDLDNKLNMNNVVEIEYNNDCFDVKSWNN